MSRTTVAKVRGIMVTELDDTVIEEFINSANQMVTKVLTNKGLSDDLLAVIEQWLTAHMIAATLERQAVKEEAGTAKVTYSDNHGTGLQGTTYGQMVLTLDTTGLLLALMKKPIIIRAIKTE